MHKDIPILKELQKIDLEIDHFEKNKHDFPKIIEKLTLTLEVEKKEVENKKQELLDLEKKKKSLELDLREKEEKDKKSEEKMMMIKSNEEYQAMKKEGEMAKQEISLIEEQILEIMLQTDQSKEKQKEVEKKIQQKNQEVSEEVKKMNEDLSKIEVLLLEKKKTRDTIAGDLKSESLSLYNRIRRKEALAVTDIEQGECLGCHISLPPQLYNEIQRGEEIHVCPNCLRILIPVVK